MKEKEKDNNQKIETFLEKWDAMLKAANEIDGFTWNFRVAITSDASLINERIKAINGVNESFSRHNMSWTSSDY